MTHRKVNFVMVHHVSFCKYQELFAELFDLEWEAF